MQHGHMRGALKFEFWANGYLVLEALRRHESYDVCVSSCFEIGDDIMIIPSGN